MSLLATSLFLISFARRAESITPSYSPPCPVESWTNKSTDSIPFNDLHEQWVNQNWSRRDNFYGAKMRLLNAFLYPEFIAVTTTVEYKTGRPAYCRYFDCRRRELPGATWQSFFFPLTTVYCVRRVGAKYVSVSSEPEEEPVEPVPLTYRDYQKPPHDVAMCVGPFYGDDKKWLQLIEFVEHHRLNDVSMFYFTIFNMEGYSRSVLDEYERLGLAEVTVVQMEYERLDWQFHLIQVHDCFHRSKHHAKWVINADIDERFTILQPDMTLIQLLNSQSPEIGELNFQNRRIQKTEFSPDTFTSIPEVIINIEAVKFNKTVFHTWKSSKSIYRPEMVAVQTYHLSLKQYPGVVVKYISKDVAVFRHYRITQMDKSIGNGWVNREFVKEETLLAPYFEKRLVENVLDMVDIVYRK